MSNHSWRFVIELLDFIIDTFSIYIPLMISRLTTTHWTATKYFNFIARSDHLEVESPIVVVPSCHYDFILFYFQNMLKCTPSINMFTREWSQLLIDLVPGSQIGS